MYCVELDGVPQVIGEDYRCYIKSRERAMLKAVHLSDMHRDKVFCVCSKPKRPYKNRQELVAINGVKYYQGGMT